MLVDFTSLYSNDFINLVIIEKTSLLTVNSSCTEPDLVFVLPFVFAITILVSSVMSFNIGSVFLGFLSLFFFSA